MKTEKPKEYIAPVVKVVEVIVEKGFVISAIIYNNRLNKVEKH
jgi:predicted nucleic acid-binding protein